MSLVTVHLLQECMHGLRRGYLGEMQVGGNRRFPPKFVARAAFIQESPIASTNCSRETPGGASAPNTIL